MKRSRLFMTMLILSVTAMAFASGGGDAGEAGQEGKSEITYWYPWGGDSETWDKWRIAEFEKANPNINVDAVYVPPDGGIANGKLLAAIAGGSAPDVVVSNTAPLAYTLATQGALEPMDDALASVGFNQSELLGPFKELMQFKGPPTFFPTTPMSACCITM